MSLKQLSRLFISLVIAMGISGFQSLAAETYDPNPIVATVESKPIRISDIEDKQINDLRKELYEILEVQLKKTAVEELGKKHPEYAKVPEFTVKDSEIRTLYELNGLSAKGTYEQFYPMIRQYILNRKEIDYIDSMYTKAVKEGLIKSYLASPNDFLVKVPVESAFLWGNKKAGVMFLEFSDYQCPFCSRVQPTISSLRERYEDRVLFGYRHSPLPFHKEADEAAIAAECARDQNKFPEFHFRMFQNPKTQFPDDLKQHAKQINIDNPARFNKCLDEERYRPRLENDIEAASEAGIKGTPGFIIGYYDQKSNTVSGEIISGAQPEKVFVDAIEKYLNKRDRS